jgi:hexosaminidase
LTDDQGWRIPIDKYPLLTSTGSCRAQTLVGRFGSDTYDNTPYCHSYTKSEIRDVVQYATQRHINIIPEIDMPGHMLAALASYPFLGCRKGPYEVMQTWGVSPEVLCAGNDSTYVFMQHVLDEVIELFPSKYIHIGGDECPKERWKTCPVCQQRIRTEGLKDEHELQSYFIRRMEKYVLSKGRNIIGWDEILEGGLAPHATVMSWRGIKGGIEAAKQHHDVIMSPESPLYLNHQQSRMEDSVTQGGYNPLEAVYAYEPVPDTLSESESRYILGPQGNMWSEYISNMDKLQYMLFPRIAALSEIAWTQQVNRSWDRFRQGLPVLMKRYDQLGIRYSTAYYDPQPQVIPLANNGIGWKMERNGTMGKLMISTPSEPDYTLEYTRPIHIKTPGSYKARVVLPDGRYGSSVIQQEFHYNLAAGKQVTLAQPPNVSYKGQGGFTLVDGIQNTAGMLRGAEFLGYLGRDLEATIDLGEIREVQSVVVHCFEQKPSWIYRPAKVTYYGSTNGTDYTPLGKVTDVAGTRNLLYELKIGKPYRFIKIVAANSGLIPPDNPGAGGRSWLFCDEIEVN